MCNVWCQGYHWNRLWNVDLGEPFFAYEKNRQDLLVVITLPASQPTTQPTIQPTIQPTTVPLVLRCSTLAASAGELWRGCLADSHCHLDLVLRYLGVCCLSKHRVS